MREKGSAFEKDVAARDYGGDHAVDDFFLTDDVLANLLLDVGDGFAEFFDLFEVFGEILLIFHDIFLIYNYLSICPRTRRVWFYCSSSSLAWARALRYAFIISIYFSSILPSFMSQTIMEL